MVIYTLQKATQLKETVIEILGMHTTDRTAQRSLAILQKYGAMTRQAVAEQMVQDSWNEVDKLLPTHRLRKN
jgi:hypothetical protein